MVGIVIQFTDRRVVRHCKSERNPCGPTTHQVGVYNYDGEMRFAFQCLRCKTTILSEQPIGEEPGG